MCGADENPAVLHGRQSQVTVRIEHRDRIFLTTRHPLFVRTGQLIDGRLFRGIVTITVIGERGSRGIEDHEDLEDQ